MRPFADCERLTDANEKQWKSMRTSPAACLSRRMNWRSVAFSAESGMLLMSPIVRSASTFFGWPRLSSRRCCAGTRPGLTISRRFSNGTVMSHSVSSFRRFEPVALRACFRQRPVDVFDDVVDVLDADREANGFGQDARHAL